MRMPGGNYQMLVGDLKSGYCLLTAFFHNNISPEK